MLWDPVWLALQVNILNLRPVIQSQWISVVKQCCKSMISKPVCEGKVYNNCMEALGHNRSAQEEEYWRGSLSHWNTWLHFSHCFVGLQCLNMNSPGHLDAEEMHLHHPSSTSPSPQHKQGKHTEKLNDLPNVGRRSFLRCVKVKQNLPTACRRAFANRSSA